MSNPVNKTDALRRLAKMEQTSLVRRMIAVVKANDKVPLWVANEIEFDETPLREAVGNNSGNAFLNEDFSYHGGFTE